MKTWGEFAVAAPDLAEKGRRLLYRTGSGEALLVTVRGASLPRVHPVAVVESQGGLYVFVLPSPKLGDLEQDGRFAIHAYPDAEVPHEFQLRGRVRRVPGSKRDRLAADWPFDPGSAPAFEFLIADALLAERASRSEWPPRYNRWTAGR